LMELHTLGVDAGYTQADVFDAARCLSGWGIDNLDTGGSFYYDPARHDTGAKSVFGLTLAAGGQKDDGDRLLDHLATHPGTARLISRKLAQRFVSDDPPSALIDRCATTFLATDGDIREVLSTMFASAEFWSEAFGRGKPKTPLELVVSVVRAVNGDVTNGAALRQEIASSGMLLYECSPPTGYPNRGADWLGVSSLLGRMGFALELAANRIDGVSVDLPAAVRTVSGTPADPRSVVVTLNTEVLGQRLDPPARQTIQRAADGGSPSVVEKVTGLCLASPAMQVR
jgi:uncharacterized protein (DUF1800 family)